jgi:tRNA(adenine34) deaminase
MAQDEKWMQLAIKEALIAESSGEVPVGAVLVKDNKLVARAHNQSIAKHDPTAHAEIELLRLSGSQLNNYRLINCTLYVTLEPCAMCYGAIIHARLKRIVYGAYDMKTGVCGSSANFKDENCFLHKPEIRGGVLQKKCGQLLIDFFKMKRL